MTIGAVATCFPSRGCMQAFAIISLVVAIVNAPSVAVSVAFGTALRCWMTDARHLKIFNISMALLLVLPLYPLLFGRRYGDGISLCHVFIGDRLVNHFVVISGCSGGGKSTLLAELQRRGHLVIEEAGRRVVQEELRSYGHALPWVDMAAFLRRTIKMGVHDHLDAPRGIQRWVFFDRSLVDAASALQELTGEPFLAKVQAYPYHSRVFLAPPWPEIYEQDSERRHDMRTALAEFTRLQHDYPAQGYSVSLLPRSTVAERADFVLRTLIGY